MVLSAATAAKWYPGHLRIVQQVHRRKPRSIFHTGQFLTGLSIFEIRTATGLFNPAGIRLFQPMSTGSVMASGHCLAVFIFHKPRNCSATRKGGDSPHSRNARFGHVGPHGTIPQQRKTRVAFEQASSGRSGVVPMTVPRKRTCQPRLPGRSETLTRKRIHYERPDLPTENTLPPMPGIQGPVHYYWDSLNYADMKGDFTLLNPY